MHQPKGSMCASCNHSARDCSSLKFDKMRTAKKYNDGTKAVICDQYERRVK